MHHRTYLVLRWRSLAIVCVGAHPHASARRDTASNFEHRPPRPPTNLEPASYRQLGPVVPATARTLAASRASPIIERTTAISACPVSTISEQNGSTMSEGLTTQLPDPCTAIALLADQSRTPLPSYQLSRCSSWSQRPSRARPRPRKTNIILIGIPSQ